MMATMKTFEVMNSTYPQIQYKVLYWGN
jgi:hypothetical protein